MTTDETMERTISLLKAAAMAEFRGEELLERGRSVSPFHLCYLHLGEFCLVACLSVLLVCFCFCRVFWFLFLFVGWFSYTQCNSCLPTARGSLPLTRAGTFSGQSTFSDRRSFVRVAAVAQNKKKKGCGCFAGLDDAI